MKVTRVIAVAIIMASAGVGLSHAQSLARTDGLPAEFPPSSFKGNQYIDSRGCVFIRAGIDGNVTWVPRVNRARKLICGQTPSLGAGMAAAPAPTQAAASAQITVAPPAPKPAAAIPAPRPVVAAAPPRPAPKRVAAPRRVAVARAPTLAPSKVATGQTAVTAPSSSQVAGSEAARVQGKNTQGSDEVALTGDTRIVPRHVYVARLNTQRFSVPPGYQAAWGDDRLNPRRAEQTLDGHARMQLVWTSTVPRRLVNEMNGADVTAMVPLVYPYTDIATQQRELGQVTLERREGVLVKRILRNPGTPAYRAPTVSSRSAPAVKPVAPARVAPKSVGVSITGKGFVSLGTFEAAGLAQAAASQAKRLGLSARIGRFTRTGREMRMVLVGPFKDAATQQRALAKVRSAGFDGAKLR